ncbi:isopeptide-forming domain-containing fimbrial protein [Paenibacillus lautus]|uniref:isopeptide-forming domain-containing fimbrial protein n=1 Tax=Paenibacillus lautus TaxID=1401 RepID=UPI002DB6D6C8|nr:isopeptide-forming domain-containing fimbrial protein [Paenibacillus lautus]MEC0307713.1 isopeptide-forming domain-containing fimbrial protein [Paenibacillus lautus]
MKRKSKISRRFKYLIAVFIILFGQLLPLYPQQAEAATDKWLNFKFDGFPEDTFNQSFTVNGAAEVPQGQNFIRLTPTATEKSGAVFNNTALCPRDNYSFSTAFSFRMGNPSAAGPSDGLTFTLQTGTTSQDVVGGGLGYYGIQPSFAVKYDSFLNTVYKDPSANYVGLAVNGTVTNDQPGWYTNLDPYNTANNTDYVLSNGTLYYTWIEYNGLSQNIQVYLGTSPDRVNASKILDVNGIDLNTIFNGQSFYAGFTGSTGYPNYETHDIHSWYFVNEYAPIETLNPQNDYELNQPPTAQDDTKTMAVNTPVSGQVNGTDPNGDLLTYTKGTDPQNGTVTVDQNGNWTYTPTQDFIGQDSFKVIVNDGKCAKTEATVNVEVSDTIPPTTPPNTCGVKVALINGSFEEGPAQGSFDPINGPFMFYENEVPGWKTTDDAAAGAHLIEIWDYAQGYPAPTVKQQPVPHHGNRYAELNAVEDGMLYQDVQTTPGQTIYWRLSHKGLYGVDTMQLRIGPATDDPYDTSVIEQMTDGNTAWGTYTGSYTVPAGQTMTRFGFEAVSTANGSIGHGNHLDDIFLGTGPCVVAEKTVSPDGAASTGQELTYEVTVKNNGGDIAANAVFEDSIPAGTEFVPGSIVVDGKSVDDSHYDSSRGMIVIGLGDVPNATQLPQGKTIQFKVKVLSGYGGIATKNQAIIKHDNLLTNKSEEVTTNEVSTSIIGEANVCPAPVAMINGSFEQGAVRGSASGGSGIYYYESEVPGWKTTDNATGQPVIELWDWARNNPSVVKNWPAPPDGGKWAELNAFENGMLYQDVKTTPGQTINWRLSHMGRQGVDTMQVRIGAATANPYDTEIQQQITDGNKAWGTYTGIYKVPAGQTVTRFGFEAVSTASGSIGAGNFIDDIFLGTAPCVTANKTASPQDVSAGDEVTYEIQIKNEGGDIAADASVTDLIPQGTEYVPGSMKLTQGSTTKDLTDADDTDAGRFDGSQVSIQLGDLANTSQLADGVTVQFKVKVLASAANQKIKNKALISYDNLLTGDTEEKETNETTTPVRFNPPVLESNKTAILQTKATGNTDADHPEVGDTLRYTIQARNTVDNSFVSSLVISDDIPAGLQYVPGSMKVDGVSVTDDESDQDGGLYNGDQIVGLFGDIADTEWHTLEFEAIIATGQAGKNIRNTAIVGGENVSTPSNAEEVVQVYPRHPVVESEKIAENLDAGKTNFEVGDTIVYTIRTRTVTDDTYISNLKITDTLPAGLEYVPGSLKVDGKSVTDAESDDNGHYVTGSVYGGFGDIWDKDWHTLEFHAAIQTGQAGKDIRNIASVSGENFEEPSMPEEEVKVYPRNPIVVSEKSAANLEAGKQTFEVGDTVTYVIRTRTVIGDTYMANLAITDTLPAGLEYIPGSLKVDGVSVTDDKDSDKGHYASGQVVGNVGDVWDTKWHTLEFQAKIVANAGQSIRNTGEITGDNIDDPSRPTDEIVVEDGGTPPVDPPVDPPVTPPVNPPVDPDPPVTPPVTPPTPPSPIIESRKTSKDINGGSIAVGDTMEYTISARNTVSGSYVSNLVIADFLPEGLAYVAGSLKVDGVSATDNTDGDKGQYVGGKVSGNFGRITDTEWHTIEFKATVKAGQAGKMIENIGEVTADNVARPEKPSDAIVVSDNEDDNNTNPGGTGDSDGDSNEDPNGNSNEDSNGDSNGDSNTGAQTPDDHNDSTLGVSDSNPRNPAESGKPEATENGPKLPDTATNMYSYMLAGCILLLAGLLLLRRRKV